MLDWETMNDLSDDGHKLGVTAGDEGIPLALAKNTNLMVERLSL